jgi:hypothetical protein
LVVVTSKYRPIWVNFSSVSGGLSIPESSLDDSVVGEDHSANTLWLVEFVNSTDVRELVVCDVLNFEGI